MNITTAKRAELVEYVSKLEQEVKLSRQQTSEAIEIGNYFGANLTKIESIIQLSLIKGDPNKPFWFIVKNYKAILQIIADIFEVIKEVRRKLEEIRNSRNAESQPG